jgi:hypothetical protein
MEKYILTVFGKFNDETSCQEFALNLEPIVDSEHLKFQYRENVLVFHFGSEFKLNDIHEFLELTSDHNFDSFILTEFNDKVSVFMSDEMKSHLFDLDNETEDAITISLNNRSNYFNSKLIRTNNINSGFYLEMSKSIDSLLQSSLTLNLDWNQARSDNPNFQNTNNVTYQISTKQELTLPLQFKLIGELDYQILPSTAAFADNQTYILLNGSLEKSFLKENALTLRFSAYDILGQNRSVWRNMYQNTRSETINQALTRYFMLTMVYKFKNKRKQGSNDSDF